MSLTAGIVGLPNVGKSTLFNALTKRKILVANYPFATIEPNVGIVTVPDERLNILTDIYQPKEIIPTTFEFIDIAGLVKGASTGEGLGNQFLSHIKEVDAICQVVRCFEDSSIIHLENEIDPIRDIEIINLELILADLQVIENRIIRIEKKALTTKDKDSLEELDVLKKIYNALKQDVPARKLTYTEEELKFIKGFNLLTIKPIIYLANVGEKDLGKPNKYLQTLEKYLEKDNSKLIEICAKVEEEINELSDEDKEEYLTVLGQKESGLDQVIRKTYSLLNLGTFFTCGEKEVKAWTFVKGMKAPNCAGIVHSDFEKGFIRAEIISYEDLLNYGNEKRTREAGKVRIEGKNYIVKDGDICHFRFNVN